MNLGWSENEPKMGPGQTSDHVLFFVSSWWYHDDHMTMMIISSWSYDHDDMINDDMIIMMISSWRHEQHPFSAIQRYRFVHGHVHILIPMPWKHRFSLIFAFSSWGPLVPSARFSAIGLSMDMFIFSFSCLGDILFDFILAFFRLGELNPPSFWGNRFPQIFSNCFFQKEKKSLQGRF